MAENYDRPPLQHQCQSLPMFLLSQLLPYFLQAVTKANQGTLSAHETRLRLNYRMHMTSDYKSLRSNKDTSIHYWQRPCSIKCISLSFLLLTKKDTSIKPAKQLHFRGTYLDCLLKSARSFSWSMTNMITTCN